jgi:hypothetical protein
MSAILPSTSSDTGANGTVLFNSLITRSRNGFPSED